MFHFAFFLKILGYFDEICSVVMPKQSQDGSRANEKFDPHGVQLGVPCCFEHDFHQIKDQEGRCEEEDLH